MKSITIDWFSLGNFLGVSYTELKIVERDHSGNLKRCRQEMLMSWISSGKATWSVLVTVLRSDDMNEPGVAERIEAKYLT